MKKSIKRITALTLSTLMSVSAIGGVTASAAEVESNPADTMRTIYFVNNKDWSDVYAHIWGNDGKTTQFPGVKLDSVGTTTVIGGKEKDVYKITINTADYDAFKFNSPSTDNQSTNDVYLDWTGSNCFYLDDNNKAVPKKDFSVADIKADSSVLTSDGTRTITVDTTNYNCAEPTVTFVRTGGSIADATKVEKVADGRYTVTVPEGTFIRIDVLLDGEMIYQDAKSNTTNVYAL